MTTILGIGTSSPALSLALFDHGECVAHDHRIIGRGHAEALIPAIAALPGQGRAGAIVVDVGPGSFTGIRIGIAAARALGLAWNVPVHGVAAASLVAAAAFAAHPGLPAVTVLLDAGRGQLLVQTVKADFTATPLETLTPAQLAPSGTPVAGAGALLLPPGHAHTVLHTAQPDLAGLLLLPEAARRLPPAAHYARPPDAVLPL